MIGSKGKKKGLEKEQIKDGCRRKAEQTCGRKCRQKMQIGKARNRNEEKKEKIRGKRRRRERNR
jgi:hypothetical protein